MPGQENPRTQIQGQENPCISESRTSGQENLNVYEVGGPGKPEYHFAVGELLGQENLTTAHCGYEPGQENPGASRVEAPKSDESGQENLKSKLLFD